MMTHFDSFCLALNGVLVESRAVCANDAYTRVFVPLGIGEKRVATTGMYNYKR